MSLLMDGISVMQARYLEPALREAITIGGDVFIFAKKNLYPLYLNYLTNYGGYVDKQDIEIEKVYGGYNDNTKNG
jgi:hypothetical protein